MGDLALALRREISSKTSRDELSVILGEIKDRIEGRVTVSYLYFFSLSLLTSFFNSLSHF